MPANKKLSHMEEEYESTYSMPPSASFDDFEQSEYEVFSSFVLRGLGTAGDTASKGTRTCASGSTLDGPNGPKGPERLTGRASWHRSANSQRYEGALSRRRHKTPKRNFTAAPSAEETRRKTSPTKHSVQ